MTAIMPPRRNRRSRFSDMDIGCWIAPMNIPSRGNGRGYRSGLKSDALLLDQPAPPSALTLAIFAFGRLLSADIDHLNG